MSEDVRDKIRRTISGEFVRMEDDFDKSRQMRSDLIDKMMTDVSKINLLNADNQLKEDADTGIRLYSTVLKALSDTERANVQAIGLKLKQQEQDIASAAAAKDRIAVVIRATAPGRIEEDFPTEDLEKHLSEMFDGEIKDHELKTNPRSLDESVLD